MVAAVVDLDAEVHRLATGQETAGGRFLDALVDGGDVLAGDHAAHDGVFEMCIRDRYTITSGRTVVSRRCKISVEAQNASQFTVEPSHVEVMVEVPEALARNTSYLKRLEVMVVPPALEPGQKGTAEPRIQLPEGMTILNPSFDSVTITRKK